MLKCPFCGSEDTQHLPSSDNISKKYVKETGKGMMQCTESGTRYYQIHKAICMNCGYVFQKMNDESLKKYHEEKQFFTN